MMDDFLRVMNARYACKKFDASRKLSSSQKRFLLECARLSPSSFGIEPWFFIAIETGDVMSRLGDACFAQEAVYTAAFAVCILVAREDAFALDSPILRERAARFPGGLDAFLNDYRGYHDFLEAEGRLLSWSRSQAYITAANMMTGAKFSGIDSCAIEGFDENRLIEVTGMDPGTWAAGLVVVFGYPGDPPRMKIREPIDKISRFL